LKLLLILRIASTNTLSFFINFSFSGTRLISIFWTYKKLNYLTTVII